MDGQTRKRLGAKKDNDWKFGTWNVRTLLRSGALRAMAQELERYKMDVAAIQEVRWMGENILETRKYAFLIERICNQLRR